MVLTNLMVRTDPALLEHSGLCGLAQPDNAGLELQASDKIFQHISLHLLSLRVLIPILLCQVVLWDKIILRGENALLDYRSMNTKYYFWDDGNGLLSHKNVTMTLSWNIIPNAGNLPRYSTTMINSGRLFINPLFPLAGSCLTGNTVSPSPTATPLVVLCEE